MHSKKSLILAIFISFTSAAPGYADEWCYSSSDVPPGTFDISFGPTNGINVTTVDPESSYRSGGIASLPDGSHVISGYLSKAGNSSLLITKHSASGTVDPSFGLQGFFEYSAPLPGSGDFAYVQYEQAKLLTQSDGKLFSVSRFSQLSTNQITRFDRLAVIRLNPDGTADQSFGQGGVAYVAIPPSVPGLITYSLTPLNIRLIETNGSRQYLVSGYFSEIGKIYGFIAKIDEQGHLITNFGAPFGGAFKFDGHPIRDAVINQSGEVFATFNNISDGLWGVLKLDQNGTPSSDFGTDGVVYLPHPFGSNDWRNRATTPGEISFFGAGSLLIAGNVEGYDNTNILHKDLFVAKASAARGEIDQSFAGGFAMFDFGYIDDFAKLILQPNNKILVGASGRPLCGANYPTNCSGQMGLVRFLPSGQLDQDFGSGGATLRGWSESGDSYNLSNIRVQSIALETNGTILMVGDKSHQLLRARIVGEHCEAPLPTPTPTPAVTITPITFLQPKPTASSTNTANQANIPLKVISSKLLKQRGKISVVLNLKRLTSKFSWSKLIVMTVIHQKRVPSKHRLQISNDKSRARLTITLSNKIRIHQTNELTLTFKLIGFPPLTLGII